MANDKDFIVKNAVEVGGSTKTTLGTVTNNNIDLSTGNYFAHSPAGATTYTISNAATNQSFQLEVTGGTEEVAQNFSTTTYTGNDGAQTITNGIDLANDGGLIWTKNRDQTGGDHSLIDSETSWASDLVSNKTDAAVNPTYLNFVANSDGYSINTAAFRYNENTREYVSWVFKKAAGFFDVVTYTGNATTRTIPHNLNADIGAIFIKRTDSTGDWDVFHKDATTGDGVRAFLNQTSTFADYGNVHWDISEMSTSVFGLGNMGNMNASGGSYIAYLFAHDTASDGLIQCGSFVNDLSSVNVEVNLGWQPQWLLIKGASSGSGLGHWYIYDNSRTGQVLSANQSAAESADTSFTLTSNGFTPTTNFGGTLVYIAIRSAADLDLTWPTSIEWAGGIAPAAPATGETDLFSISTDDGGTTYQGFKTADNLS